MLTTDQIDDLAEPPLPLPADERAAPRSQHPNSPETQSVLIDPVFAPPYWALLGWTVQPR